MRRGRLILQVSCVEYSKQKDDRLDPPTDARSDKAGNKAVRYYDMKVQARTGRTLQDHY
jgi:hypothetical protein